MIHHTKDKGDLAVVKTIADLTCKNFYVLRTIVSEHLPFDIVGYKDNKFIRFQVKYSKVGHIRDYTTWTNKDGARKKYYSKNDFDYYAIYLPDKDVVCYPSIEFRGAHIRSKTPKSATPFYWYEDFLNLTDIAEKRNFRDFGIQLRMKKSSRLKQRKVTWPSKEEFEIMLWSKPMTEIAKDFNVSNKAVSKWAKYYNLKTPKQGHWLKLENYY